MGPNEDLSSLEVMFRSCMSYDFLGCGSMGKGLGRALTGAMENKDDHKSISMYEDTIAWLLFAASYASMIQRHISFMIRRYAMPL